MSTEDSFSFRVLDSLVNAPSSVAGIYADLVYLLGFDRRQVLVPLRQALDRLEDRGWVLARLQKEGGELEQASTDIKERCWKRYASWLPDAAQDDLAADEVALWYGITEPGRTAWSAWADEPKDATWQLDDDAIEHRITVVAESENSAQQRLEEWLSKRGCIASGGKQVSAVAEIRLRSGQVLAQGVRLTCSYRQRASN